MGSKDGFVELGFTYELGPGDRFLSAKVGDVGNLRHDPGHFELVEFLHLFGGFSAPAFGTFYILDGATYAELEQMETGS